VREVLGPDALGAYLFGSAAVGGLKPASDLDVLAVAARPTTLEEKRRLSAWLLASSRPPHRLELTIVVRSQVRPWRYPPTTDFQYGDWLRGEFERGEVEPAQPASPDLTVLLAMVLLADRPLFGPPPAELLDPIPPDDVARASLAEVDDLLAGLEHDTRNVILTLARIWSTLETGVIRSKDAAADWALERLPPEQRAPLARARAIYVGDEEERWDDLAAQVRPHADYVVARISRRSPPSPPTSSGGAGPSPHAPSRA
jgi:streptomycin 3"-adenylyltransferase